MYTTSYSTSTFSLQPPKWLDRNQQVISDSEAGKYVGSTRTVEGTILGTDHSNPNTIFLYFMSPHKGHFMIAIQSSDFPNFAFTPESFYNGKQVRVTGRIQLYQGSPEILVRNPCQIEVAYMGFNYP
jgi:micrococcal nuclease